MFTKAPMKAINCFKAYDVRGRLDDELNEDIAYRIGRAFAQFLSAKSIVIGADMRLSSESLKIAAAKGMMDAGCDVFDLGMTGTEEIYFATFHLGVDGGLEVTASHNPIDYNGMKFVGKGASPISSDAGLPEIKAITERGNFIKPAAKGEIKSVSVLDEYVAHLLGYVDVSQWQKPLKLVMNAGNGVAGHVVDALEAKLRTASAPVELIKIHNEADGRCPNGIPNPLLVENQSATTDAVLRHGADIGIAWDGDFDRCFLFDEKGAFIDGYYIVGLLAEMFLQAQPNEKIIHDPRLVWNTIDVVHQAGGTPVQSKSGHSFIKEKMREQDAIYGGEMSAHHYFRDFGFCDSGMIPWLMVVDLLSKSGQSLSEILGSRIAKYPCSGEINYQVKNPADAISRVKSYFEKSAIYLDDTDGLSFEFTDWRFNLRASNTEPLLRLNIETRADAQDMSALILAIEALISA